MEAFSPLSADVEFDNIDNIIHAAEYAIFLLQLLQDPLWCQYRDVYVALVVDPPDGVAVLDLADDVVDLVGEVVVGHVAQQLVLDLLEEVADLLELLDVCVVLQDELRKFFGDGGGLAWRLGV